MGGGESGTTVEDVDGTDGTKGRCLVLVPLEPLRRLQAVLVPLDSDFTQVESTIGVRDDFVWASV